MKRIISIALVLILIISLLPMTSLKALAADVNEGDGSVENPWLITNEADYVLHIFNSTFESGHYKLTEDIVLDAATGDDTANGNQNGSSTGRVINIDLNGHTICAVGGNYRFFSCGAEGELTLKNGSVIVDRTYENSFGAVFNILNGGKLTLENMDVSEIGKVAYEKNGELLYVAAGSSAVIKIPLWKQIPRKIKMKIRCISQEKRPLTMRSLMKMFMLPPLRMLHCPAGHRSQM